MREDEEATESLISAVNLHFFYIEKFWILFK